MNRGIKAVAAAAIGATIGYFIYKKTKEVQAKVKEEHRHIPYGSYEVFRIQGIFRQTRGMDGYYHKKAKKLSVV